MTHDSDKLSAIMTAVEALGRTTERQADTLASLTSEVAKHIKRSDASDKRVTQVEAFVLETRTYMRGIKVLGVFLAGAIAVAVGILQLIKGI